MKKSLLIPKAALLLALCLGPVSTAQAQSQQDPAQAKQQEALVKKAFGEMADMMFVQQIHLNCNVLANREEEKYLMARVRFVGDLLIEYYGIPQQAILQVRKGAAKEAHETGCNGPGLQDQIMRVRNLVHFFKNNPPKGPPPK